MRRRKAIKNIALGLGGFGLLSRCTSPSALPSLLGEKDKQIVSLLKGLYLRGHYLGKLALQWAQVEALIDPRHIDLHRFAPRHIRNNNFTGMLSTLGFLDKLEVLYVTAKSLNMRVFALHSRLF